MRIPTLTDTVDALFKTSSAAARKGAKRNGSIHTGTASDEELAELVLSPPGKPGLGLCQTVRESFVLDNSNHALSWLHHRTL